MIRIRRGPEPANLPTVRKEELQRIRPLALQVQFNRKDLGNRYSEVKRDLWLVQNYKCCYCEKPYLEASHSDVEHFRPALRARRGNGFPDHGYWWLAWTWTNLLFSCKNCNSSAKGDQFPLDAGSVVLQPKDRSLKGELPLLIDPCRENPLAHIQFRPVNNKERIRWFAFPRKGSRKGFKTIEILKLNRPELLDLYNIHVDHHVLPLWRKITYAIQSGSKSTIQNLNADVTALVHPARPFVALSYDVIDHHFPIGERRKWGIRLSQPK